MTYTTWPKIELHVHLDCSLSYEVVHQLNPVVTLEQYRASFIAPGKCTDLNDYIARASSAIDLMQTREALRWVTLDLLRQFQADHVIYAEIRFAPLLHITQGLSAQEVVQTVNDAVVEGMAETGVQANIILCTLRHFSEFQSMQTVKLVEANLGTRVVGFDIASDEAGFPIDAHVKAFAYARAAGLHVTAHAGEAKGPESVWETLEHFQPARIGHGVRSAEDPALLAFLQEQGIHLEVCPTSNVQTNVVDRIADHPADVIYKSGVSMSVNTDGRTISDTTLVKEYALLEQVFDWEKAHFLKCNLEAINHAFTTDGQKAELRERVLKGFG